MLMDVLDRARDGQKEAVEQVLLEYYPTVHRMAYALSGREDTGRGIVRYVMWQATKALPKWTVEGMPQRWFYHHTVLVWRRTIRHQPQVQQDTLVGTVQDPPAAYLAFIRALRQLPMQQREAFILHHGEHFDERTLAVAMDCSREAAANHLQAAVAHLKAVSGEYFAALVNGMDQAYAHLVPTEEIILSHVRRTARRRRWQRGIVRSFKAMVILAILGAIAYAGWWIYRNFDFSEFWQP